jgi:site-specific recombinase XerD
MKSSMTFAGLLEAFFTDRLMRQREVSRHTIISYRETFRQLLGFVQERCGKPPSKLSMEDLDAPLISAFLDHAEKERGLSPRSRNVRLAAIRSFFRYVALQEPRCSALVQRVLAMPNKKFERRQVSYLTRDEVQALLAAPDRKTRSGRRDHTLLLVAVGTGLRCSELAGLRIEDAELSRGAHLRCRGKGRKERCTPLRKETVAVLHNWLRERGGQPPDPIFPSARGLHLSVAGIEYIVRKHVAVARTRCASLRRKRVSPHCLRHTLAMDLLQSGVDRSVIALWLGHESPETTQVYLDADLALKERALSRTAPFDIRAGRYRPGDQLLEFLKSL